jgi:transcription antitermination factor NusG
MAKACPAVEDGKRWYAVQVYTGREQLTAESMRERSFDEFTPVQKVRRRWSDRVKEIEAALFPGYLFCHMTPEMQAPLKMVPGVLGVVGFGQRIIPIDDAEIESIRVITESGLISESHPYLQPGSKVRISDGPFAGIEGTVLRENSKHRFIVSVPLLNRSVSVELDPRWLGAA